MAALDWENRPVAPAPIGNGYGMTLREHFAGLALQGYLAGRPQVELVDADTMLPARVARGCVHYADALLAELDKGKT